MTATLPATPPSRRRVVCLCGSTRFTDQFAEANRWYTAAGYVVLAPGCDLKTSHPLWDTDQKIARLKPLLDSLHRDKIDMAHEVVVVTDRQGYVGESTRAEIAYAERTGKPVAWWSA